MSSTATLPQQGTETVNSLAGKIKAKYPDYQSTDNHELVSRVITKHPEYQTHLSTEELQRIAGGNQQPEGSAWERLASGAGSAIKPFIPESLGSHIGSAVDMASGAAPLKALGGAYQEYKHGRETGQGVLPSIAGAVGGLTGIDTAGVRERAAKGDIAGIVGEAIPPIAMTLLGGEADRLPGIREGIGNRIHDVETGKLTPKVENISRAGGAAVGGGLAGSPGAITGGLAGPSLMESLFPEGAGRVAKRAENTRYSQLGEDLTRRGAEQEAIDRRAAVQQRQSAREQSQAAKPMQDFMAGKPGPFNKLSESPNVPPKSAGIPNIGPTAPSPLEGAGGVRPSPSEQGLTNIIRRRIVSPEEAAFESRELGGSAPLEKGEGLASREARLLGTVRARRAAKGMLEPNQGAVAPTREEIPQSTFESARERLRKQKESSRTE